MLKFASFALVFCSLAAQADICGFDISGGRRRIPIFSMQVADPKIENHILLREVDAHGIDGDLVFTPMNKDYLGFAIEQGITWRPDGVNGFTRDELLERQTEELNLFDELTRFRTKAIAVYDRSQLKEVGYHNYAFKYPREKRDALKAIVVLP